jgi:hypothetical protein
MEVNGQFHSPAALLSEKGSPVPGRPKSQAGRGGEKKKNLCPYKESYPDPSVVQTVVYSMYLLSYPGFFFYNAVYLSFEYPSLMYSNLNVYKT